MAPAMEELRVRNWEDPVGSLEEMVRLLVFPLLILRQISSNYVGHSYTVLWGSRSVRVTS